ncbi:MAG: hypothetical protein FWD16_01820 [Clostridia bacterium]|nr:hypothetical protein [Clostridia bacterium]
MCKPKIKLIVREFLEWAKDIFMEWLKKIRTPKPYFTVPRFLVTMLLTLIACIALTLYYVKPHGTFKGSGYVSEAKFWGINNIVLRMGSYFDIPLIGTYTIEYNKLIINVSYLLGDERQVEKFTFDFKKEGNTITLDDQPLTKE